MKINNMLLVLNMIGADIDKLYSMVRDIVPDHIKLDMNISLNGMFMSLRGLQEYNREYIEDLFSKIDFKELDSQYDVAIGVAPMNEDGPTFSVIYDYETREVSIEEKEIDTILGKVVMTGQKESQYNSEKWNLIHKFRNGRRVVTIEVDDNYRYVGMVPNVFIGASLRYLDVDLPMDVVTNTLQTIVDGQNNVMTLDRHQIYTDHLAAPFSPISKQNARIMFGGGNGFANARSIRDIIAMYTNVCVSVEDTNTKDVSWFYFTFLQ